MTTAIYDTQVGATYDATRNADPEITQQLMDHLTPKTEGHYLDFGCGTGNYTLALAKRGLKMTGLDLSEQMLRAAKNKSTDIAWVQGSARDMPFESNTFDGAVCTLALHLIGKLKQTASEAYRVINQGNFVTFTFTPEMIKHYWLCHYFPKCMKKSADKMHTEEELTLAFEQAGFSNIKKTPYFISKDIADSFLYTGKNNPQSYLDPKIRANISAFSIANENKEIEQGVKQLKADIESGRITDIMSSYSSTHGDCFILSGEKR